MNHESGTVTFQKNECYFLDWKPFKNDEKCLLFYPKSSFRSQDISQDFCSQLFGHVGKTAWLERSG